MRQQLDPVSPAALVADGLNHYQILYTVTSNLFCKVTDVDANIK